MNDRRLMRQVLAALEGKRFPLEDEKATQAAIEQTFDAAWRGDRCFALPPFAREVRITGGVIDFLVGEFDDLVGVEVKIKGRPAAIVRQLKAYAGEPSIVGLVLVTAKPVALGAHIGGKPVAVFDLARAWL